MAARKQTSRTAEPIFHNTCIHGEVTVIYNYGASGTCRSWSCKKEKRKYKDQIQNGNQQVKGQEEYRTGRVQDTDCLTHKHFGTIPKDVSQTPVKTVQHCKRVWSAGENTWSNLSDDTTRSPVRRDSLEIVSENSSSDFFGAMPLARAPSFSNSIISDKSVTTVKQTGCHDQQPHVRAQAVLEHSLTQTNIRDCNIGGIQNDSTEHANWYHSSNEDKNSTRDHSDDSNSNSSYYYDPDDVDQDKKVNKLSENNSGQSSFRTLPPKPPNRNPPRRPTHSTSPSDQTDDSFINNSFYDDPDDVNQGCPNKNVFVNKPSKNKNRRPGFSVFKKQEILPGHGANDRTRKGNAGRWSSITAKVMTKCTRFFSLKSTKVPLNTSPIPFIKTSTLPPMPSNNTQPPRPSTNSHSQRSSNSTEQLRPFNGALPPTPSNNTPPPILSSSSTQPDNITGQNTTSPLPTSPVSRLRCPQHNESGDSVQMTRGACFELAFKQALGLLDQQQQHTVLQSLPPALRHLEPKLKAQQLAIFNKQQESYVDFDIVNSK